MAKPTGLEWALRSAGDIIGRLFYRVSAIGRDQVPAGGVLLLPNHITWVDAIVLGLAIPRPIRFIIDEGVYQNRFLRPVLRAVGCIPITARKAKDGMREAIARFGLGSATRVEQVEIRWSSGHVDRLGPLAPGRVITVREGGG